MNKTLSVLAVVLVSAWPRFAYASFDVKSFGATGDGRALDSPAINRAIAAAAAAGGGTVVVPAGTYLSGSLRLASNLTLQLEPGAVIEATDDAAAYDKPEPNEWGDKLAYQDFGHSHFHNSLIWGDGLENVAIVGFGKIFGRGLARGANDEESGPPGTLGNKAIALKNCRNVTLRDFTVAHGGWFAVFAAGVDHLTLDNLKIDTNRDGFDIDGCQNVRITNCSVNSPHDDGICLKSSFVLGTARPTQNVTISDCYVSGFDEGTLLDGTRQRRYPHLYKNSRGPHGRIKLGTESNGGFQNITITNCIFEYCRGLALETVDGALIEDVTVSNLTMRDIVNAPIFLRLGARMRGPADTQPGTLRRVKISHIVAHNVAADHGILIAGLADHPIEDVVLSDIFIDYAGGGTKEQSKRVVPEYEKDYPEPYRFGTLPSWGLFARHVKNLSLDQIEFRATKEDLRATVMLDDVAGAALSAMTLPHAPGAPVLVQKNVRGFSARDCPGLTDQSR